MDQPSIDGVNTWFVAKAAHEAGLKVALSGLGGDELLGGYPSFVDLPKWHRRYRALAAIPGLGRVARVALSKVARPLARTKPKVLGLLQYSDSWAGVYLLRRGLFLPYELSEILDRDVLREGLRRLKPICWISEALNPDPKTDIRRVCALESSCYLRNQLLRDADWAGMAHGLEIRVPFVDPNLLSKMSHAMSSVANGAGKTLLANAPRLPLPDEVLRRAKTGFSVPVAAWTASVSGTRDGAEPKGLISRRWSRAVLSGVTT
jgi:asparagine synthase (glutamine-hydrolysing)